MPRGITCVPGDNSIPLYAINFTIIGSVQVGGEGGGGDSQCVRHLGTHVAGGKD
jgi:hypothetical protein